MQPIQLKTSFFVLSMAFTYALPATHSLMHPPIFDQKKAHDDKHALYNQQDSKALTQQEIDDLAWTYQNDNSQRIDDFIAALPSLIAADKMRLKQILLKQTAHLDYDKEKKVVRDAEENVKKYEERVKKQERGQENKSREMKKALKKAEAAHPWYLFSGLTFGAVAGAAVTRYVLNKC